MILPSALLASGLFVSFAFLDCKSTTASLLGQVYSWLHASRMESEGTRSVQHSLTPFEYCEVSRGGEKSSRLRSFPRDSLSRFPFLPARSTAAQRRNMQLDPPSQWPVRGA